MEQPVDSQQFIKGFLKEGVDSGVSVDTMAKLALHAEDRIKERLKMPPSSIKEIQAAVDRMWFGFGRTKLSETYYYIPIRDKNMSVKGYVALQRVGKPGKGRLVVSTILDGSMKPRGHNIGNFFNLQIAGFCLSDGYTPAKYNGMPPLPDNR
ncbi:MAG: hypothetical protein EBU46_00380 [Nitrosomonadaceae bacterium]|nr:hypothetical protein [Nitrosomonadaceae bacterium]